MTWLQVKFEIQITNNKLQTNLKLQATNHKRGCGGMVIEISAEVA